MNTTTSSKSISSKNPSGISSIIKGILGGTFTFILCILLIPFILSKTATPESYISTAVVITVSATSLVAALTANSGRHGFILTGALTSLTIILILVCLSVIFGKSETNKNYLFSAILYASSFIFAIAGARLSRRKKDSPARRRHKRK